MDDPTYVPVELVTVASEQLSNEVEKEKQIDDPVDNSIAKLLIKEDYSEED